MILDAGETILLSNFETPWYLHCNQHNIVSIPIPSYYYTIINGSLPYNYQIQGSSELLHESSSDRVNATMYFTINMAFAEQLLINFLK